jgi:MFS family permease
MVGASLLAAVAQTGGMLLAARALDGLASAAIAPMALALIASAFSQAEQAQVIGLFLGCQASARRSARSTRAWWSKRTWR